MFALDFDIGRFLITLSLMLLSAKALGELFARFKQPAIIGEIIAGLLIGPTVLGTIFPSAFNWFFPLSAFPVLEGLIILAVVLLLLVSGLEVDLSIVMKQGKTAAYVGFLGIIFPFGLGFGAVYAFPDLFETNAAYSAFLFALFLGTALSISALPVIAKSLMDLGIFKTELGFIVISAAMFNDIVGWLIFSLILGNLGTTHHPFSFGVTLILTLTFALVAVVFLRKLINKFIPMLQTRISYPGGVINFIFILGLLGAAFTEYIGIHAIFGSFIIGIAIGNSAHLKEEIRDNIHQFVTNLFAPLFFVSIGLRVNFGAYFNLPLIAVVLVLAFAGKVIGCSLGAYLGGMSKEDSLAVGFGMNSRGAMEIILGLIALEAGLINEELFVALVIMAVVTSVMGAPLMNFFLSKKKFEFSSLLKPELVLFTDESDRNAIIRRLVKAASSYYKLNEEEVYSEVMEREDENPTGIANHLALPHGRINYKTPVIAAAVNKNGIDFQSLDGTPSKIIVLLLTPKDKNELQLKLLADIGSKFRDRTKAEKYITAADPDEFIRLIKENSRQTD
jgi:Kef-type K+ transport system membrane component KefB/mannitol/fructose-specific phosphotransferase system IIA component (Ntr-type)